MLLVLLIYLLLSSPAGASDIRNNFIEAFDAKDSLRMNSIVQENLSSIPSEVSSLVEDAGKPEETAESREEKLYLAELMATAYKDQTGDVAPLIVVKKAVFTSRLSPPVRPNLADGVHIIEFPEATEHTKNVFQPDNIIIKKGETVRWVNRDKIAHVFSTMPLISSGAIPATTVEPGAHWEYRFENPGEYYLICFIHRGMIGKITVEDTGLAQ